MEDKVAAYRNIDTQGKSQIELILQVYDGAISNLNSAKKHYENLENQEGFESIDKARKFVTHLYTTLNPEKGGDIAKNLGKLYAFIINQCSLIEATKESAQIDDIIIVLNNLKEGWVGIKDQQNNSNSVNPNDSKPKATKLSITG